MRSTRIRVLRPFAWSGRYVSTGERLWLPAAEVDALLESGHVAVIVDAAPPNDSKWVQPVTR